MKRQIRSNVFETNSSMTHSLTICTEEEYNKWENGELLFDDWHGKFVNSEDNLDKDDYYSYRRWEDERCEYYYDYAEKFITPSGDKMVAFGCYGHD